MKKSLFILSFFATFTSSAFANEKSESFIASALINPQIQKEIKEFNSLVQNVSSVNVENFDDVDTIALKGTVLVGGDVACGTVSLKIERSYQPGFGFAMRAVYIAKVTKNISEGCKGRIKNLDNIAAHMCLTVNEQKTLGAILVARNKATAERPNCVGYKGAVSCLHPFLEPIKRNLEQKLVECASDKVNLSMDRNSIFNKIMELSFPAEAR